jgi:peptide chain release factor 1
MLKRHEELSTLIQDPNLVKDNKRYRETMKEFSQLQQIVDAKGAIDKLQQEAQGDEEIVRTENDAEMKAMAKEELQDLQARIAELEEKLKLMLIPRDPLDDKNIIMEIRAGTGGEEAALFAADLYRMYSRFAESKGWKFEIMNANMTELGGYKEIVFSVNGSGSKDAVYENMRYESGVHRVQRVPATEANGRIQTSAVTVAVLPEVEATEIEIRPEDCKFEVMRAGGPGGQCVNTTDSAVRLTHIPSGIVIHMQEEKSQLRNKEKALRLLRSRLYEMEEEKKQQERSSARKNQVGSGDRSERIRTYNFPQNRLTDHRINWTSHSLDLIIGGAMQDLIDALKLNAREEMLGTQGSN